MGETEGFECVPYYQCDEGTIITDGYGLIDIRFGGDDSGQPQMAILDSSDLMCPGSLDVCCKDPDFSKKNEELTDGSYGQPDEYELEEEDGYGKTDGETENLVDEGNDGYVKTEEETENLEETTTALPVEPNPYNPLPEKL